MINTHFIFVLASFSKRNRNHFPGQTKCTLFSVRPLMMNEFEEEEEEEEFLCEMDGEVENGFDGIVYRVESPHQSFFQNVTSGRTQIFTNPNRAHETDLMSLHVNETIVLDTDAMIVEDKSSSENTKITDVRPLLVLYTIAPDAVNSYRTSSEIANDVFGICDGCAEDTANLRSQIYQVSKQQLDYVPAYNDKDIINGVLEINLNKDITGVSCFTVGNWNVKAARSILAPKGLRVNDFHLFHVIPEAADFRGAVAWGEMYGRVSWYRDSHAWMVGIQMHEIGHNLGFHHSGHRSSRYGDHSCTMGDPSHDDDGPLVAFNGAKSWQSGWYQDDSLSIDVLDGQNFQGLLIGVDDYVNDRFVNGLHYVVIEILDPLELNNYYMIFNRKEGVNSGVEFNPDKLVIVSGERNRPSSTEAFLDEINSKFTVSDFGKKNRTLVVEVCSINFVDNAQGPDTVSVLVYMDDDLKCPTVRTPSNLRKLTSG